nr:probable pectinesterase 29 [Arachis hypogaea]
MNLFHFLFLPLLLLVSLFCYISVSLAQNCNSKISRTIIVDQSGKSKFKTVQSAIDSIPENNNQWVKIHINAETYKEKVHIPCQKPCIFLEGEGIDVTTITYNDHQSTDQSATFSSSPDNVVASKITFKNSFDVGKMLSLKEIKDGNYAVPALSARIYGDKSGFYDCRFVGYQDTLWDVEGRHYFKNCIIEGAVDFIFGSGQSYFEVFIYIIIITCDENFDLT